MAGTRTAARGFQLIPPVIADGGNLMRQGFNDAARLMGRFGSDSPAHIPEKQLAPPRNGIAECRSDKINAKGGPLCQIGDAL